MDYIPVKVSCYRHLLIELGRLGKEGGSFEVRHLGTNIIGFKRKYRHRGASSVPFPSTQFCDLRKKPKE